MVIDHRKITPETMEVLQNEWKAYCLVKIALSSSLRNQTVEKETGNAHRGI
jgi:hypothetical protein